MIKLTTKQLKLLDDVFNYALNFMEETTKTSMLFKEGKDGKFTQVKYKDFEKDVLALAETLNKNIEIIKEGVKAEVADD